MAGAGDFEQGSQVVPAFDSIKLENLQKDGIRRDHVP